MVLPRGPPTHFGTQDRQPARARPSVCQGPGGVGARGRGRARPTRRCTTHTQVRTWPPPPPWTAAGHTRADGVEQPDEVQGEAGEAEGRRQAVPEEQCGWRGAAAGGGKTTPISCWLLALPVLAARLMQAGHVCRWGGGGRPTRSSGRGLSLPSEEDSLPPRVLCVASYTARLGGGPSSGGTAVLSAERGRGMLACLRGGAAAGSGRCRRGGVTCCCCLEPEVWHWGHSLPHSFVSNGVWLGTAWFVAGLPGCVHAEEGPYQGERPNVGGPGSLPGRHTWRHIDKSEGSTQEVDAPPQSVTLGLTGRCVAPSTNKGQDVLSPLPR